MFGTLDTHARHAIAVQTVSAKVGKSVINSTFSSPSGDQVTTFNRYP